MKNHLVRLLPVATLALASVLFPAAASARKKPHLTVTSVKAAPNEQKPLHSFWNGSAFQLIATIKNKGDAASKDGQGALKVARPGNRFFTESDFDLAGIKPGKQKSVALGTFGRVLSDEGLGPRIPQVCVPVSGRGGGTSCRAGPRFAVIPRRWSGSIDSTTDADVYNDDAIYEITFRYDSGKSAQTRFFHYRVASGKASLAVSGLDARGCSWSGGLETSPDQLSSLDFSPAMKRYGLTIHPKKANYEVTINCGKGGTTHEDHTFVGPGLASHPIDLQETTWKGSDNDPFQKLSWELDARA
ncbi:MAG: hypothetical protein U0R52_06480 [Solirubrobacterales bacterium]